MISAGRMISLSTNRQAQRTSVYRVWRLPYDLALAEYSFNEVRAIEGGRSGHTDDLRLSLSGPEQRRKGK
jgi:hypothetical protein